MRSSCNAILVLLVSCFAFGQTYTIQTFAGNGTQGYSGDGDPATSAQLDDPLGIAVDAAGNLYIADEVNNRIRRVSNGVITTVAGNGTGAFSGDGGPATSSELHSPFGVAVDAAGNLYIADAGNNRIRRVSNGVITTVAGSGTEGYSGDNGPATSAQLDSPYGVAVDAAGNLYIADTYNNRIRKVSNGVITTVAGTGTKGYSGDNGPAASAQLDYPQGVAVDAAGNLYIADEGDSRIRKVSNGVITTVAGSGIGGYSGDGGPATSALLNFPSAIAVDAAGNLYIADEGNNRIRGVSNGVITTIAGNGMGGYSGDGGPATTAELSRPEGVAVDTLGNVYVADWGNQRVRILIPSGSCNYSSYSISPSTVSFPAAGGPTTIAVMATAGCTWTASSQLPWVMITSGSSGIGNGTVTILVAPNSGSAALSGTVTVAGLPFSVTEAATPAAASAGEAYTITTAAGNGVFGLGGDGGPATSANLEAPVAVAVDAAGNLYIADNNRIRQVSNGVIMTVAGNGVDAYSGDGGPATSAELDRPFGLAVDAAGSLYIADTFNLCVRKISNGVITTIAGNVTFGYSGDGGPATSAQLANPEGVAVDAIGDLYIADTSNNRIRKVSNGVITTVVGNGSPGYSGDGGQADIAQVNNPTGIAVDAAGNFYIADSRNNRIRKVSNGVITTIAGKGTEGYSGDGGSATSAQLNNPLGVAVDSAGNVYITDFGNDVIREVLNGVIMTIAGNGTEGYSSDGGPATSAELNMPVGVAVDTVGRVYVADSFNYRVRLLTPFTATISNVSPSAARAGGPAFTLTVNGSGFVNGSTVDWNGSPVPTAYVNAGQLTASIAASLIASAGSASITVVTTGVGTSNAVTFTINPTPPVISGLSPSAVTAGGPAFTLTVDGSGFTSGSTIQWNGTAAATSFVSANQLTASIPANLIASPGSVTITVVDTTTGTSNAVIFAIGAAPGAQNGQLISHIADGGGWRSIILLANTGTVAAPYTVSFWNDAGSPYLPSLASGVPSGSIPLGGSTIIESADAASALAEGWAQVTSSQSVGGTAIFRYDASGQEAAVPLLTSGGVKLEIPYQLGNGLSLGVALANTNTTQTANITEVIRDQNGNQLASRTLTLAPLNHTAFNPTFPGSATVGGVVEYDSNVNIFGLGIRSAAEGSGLAFTSLDAVLPAAASTKTISHIADGGGWRSTIILVNTDTVPAQYTVSFWTDTGSPYVPPLASGFPTGTIPVGGSTIIETADTASALSEGWAQVTSSEAVGGTAIFRYDPWGQEAAVPLLTSGGTALEIPYQVGSGLSLGVALANPSSTQTANITEVIRDENGNQLSSRMLTLAPQSHTAFNPTFPANATGGGVVEYDSNASIYGLGIRSAPEGSGLAFTSVRAVYK
jgi:sugar lactone lactonase YvrE